jgi:hypothetical protein
MNQSPMRNLDTLKVKLLLIIMIKDHRGNPRKVLKMLFFWKGNTMKRQVPFKPIKVETGTN